LNLIHFEITALHVHFTDYETKDKRNVFSRFYATSSIWTIHWHFQVIEMFSMCSEITVVLF